MTAFLPLRGLYGVVVFWFFLQGFVDDGRDRHEAWPQEAVNDLYVGRDDLVHEEIALAEEVALLRFDFVVETAFFFDGHAEVAGFIRSGDCAFVLPEFVEEGFLGAVAADEVAVRIEAFICDDVEVFYAQGLRKDAQEVEDEVLRSVAEELFRNDFRVVQAVGRSLDSADVNRRTAFLIVIEAQIELVDEFTFVSEVECQKAFLALAAQEEEPCFQGKLRIGGVPQGDSLFLVHFLDGRVGEHGTHDIEVMRQGGEAFLRGRIFVEEDPGDDVYHMVFSFHEAWQGIVVVEVGVQVFYEAAVTEAAQKEDEAPFTLPEVVCAVDFFCNVPVM